MVASSAEEYIVTSRKTLGWAKYSSATEEAGMNFIRKWTERRLKKGKDLAHSNPQPQQVLWPERNGSCFSGYMGCN
jgi:hypothetical protein